MNIEIDFEVYKALTVRRESESDTYNNVIRRLLGFEPHDQSMDVSGVGWTSKGVHLPAGTLLRATFKGKQYLAQVRDGRIDMQGMRFPSLSAAAVHITGYATNGWNFWEAKLPECDAWELMQTMRQTEVQG